MSRKLDLHRLSGEKLVDNLGMLTVQIVPTTCEARVDLVDEMVVATRTATDCELADYLVAAGECLTVTKCGADVFSDNYGDDLHK